MKPHFNPKQLACASAFHEAASLLHEKNEVPANKEHVVMPLTRWFQCMSILTAVAFWACHGRSPVPTQPTQTTPSQGGSPPPVLPTPSQGYDDFNGAYKLTLEIGSSCEALPESERTRTYDASIGASPNQAYPGHVVTLSGARFLSGPICTVASGMYAGIGCNQFLASEDIDWVGFWLQNNNDDAHGAHIVEQKSSGAWLEIIGRADGTLTSFSSIEAAGTANVWFCPSSTSYPFPCPGYRSCSSTDLRLRFNRK
jgi:hypothetical protein